MAWVQFGRFEFNAERGELLRDGREVRLQAQPAKALALLISARGELVTREAFREALWEDGVSVDFDRSLNFTIAQVRTALGDSADSPTYIRTVPKRGYQLIAPVSERAAAVTVETPSPQRRRRLLRWIAAVALCGVVGLVALSGWSSAETRIAVARFQNETGNPSFDRVADTITDSVVAGLTAQGEGRYGIIGNAAILRRGRTFQDLDEIGSTLKAKYVIVGQVQQDGPGVRLLAHLIRLPEKTHLKVVRQQVTPSASESELAKRIVDEFASKLGSSAAATR